VITKKKKKTKKEETENHPTISLLFWGERFKLGLRGKQKEIFHLLFFVLRHQIVLPTVTIQSPAPTRAYSRKKKKGGSGGGWNEGGEP